MHRYTRTARGAAKLAGVEWRYTRALKYLGKFFGQYRAYRAKGGVVTQIHPVLIDYANEAGVASGHYFHQDLLVASFVHAASPRRHVDVGSRIDGFVAHVASFREIEVLDVRDMRSTGHENIIFRRSNMIEEVQVEKGVCDSISCLHALEHFGLGRYSDPIDPEGHLKGFKNLVRMLEVGGRLYLSVPVGRGDEVHFNAHRVFHPRSVPAWPTDAGDRLELERFDFVDDQGVLHSDIDVDDAEGRAVFGCGIYTFRKEAG
jgi:hypothetical protein